jgi:uncharacterized protein DUF4154
MLIVVAALVWPSLPDLGGQRPLDTEVKAAYLFNFARFVRWPAPGRPPERPFAVCVIGRDPFGPVLDTTLANERIDGRSVVARRFATADGVESCDMAYLSDSEQGRVGTILRSLGSSAVLTVSDMPGFTARGGMIQFVPAGNRIRFELNLTAAERAGLMVSSELSRVAAAVHREGTRTP